MPKWPFFFNFKSYKLSFLINEGPLHKLYKECQLEKNIKFHFLLVDVFHLQDEGIKKILLVSLYFFFAAEPLGLFQTASIHSAVVVHACNLISLGPSS